MLRFCDVILKAILVAFLTKGAFTNVIVKEIDMFKEVGLLTGPLPQGVTSTQGQNRNSRAFHFTTSVQDLLANQNAYTNANTLIHDSHDFWVSAWAKLDPSNVNDNTIVSISSKDGNALYFKMEMSGDFNRGSGITVKVTVKYRSGGDPKIFEATTRNLDYSVWRKVAVRLQDGERLIRIYIADMTRPALVDLLPGIAAFPADAQLRLAQEFTKGPESQLTIEDKFKGDLQDVKFIRGSLDDCPPLTTCKCSDAFQRKKCVMDGLRYDDGARWTKSNCTICKCESGQVICTYTCKVCVDNGQQYLQDETWKMANDTCYSCRCEDGKSICSPPSCPKPNCKSGKTITPEGECCEICKEDNCKRQGKVYKSCGCEKTCANINSPSGSCNLCKEGCFCPEGKIMNKEGICEASSNCPCTYKGKEYEFGNHDLGNCKFGFCVNGHMDVFSLCQ